MAIKAIDKGGINLSIRINTASCFVLFVFFILILRLWYLQILNGDYFRFRSENNLLRTIYVPPPRGLILDRNGEVLASNRPSYDVEFVTEDSPDPEKTLTDLAEIINFEKEDVVSKLKEQKKRRKFEPKLILRDINRDLVAKISAKRHLLPGVVINVVPTREYKFGDFASHTIGYIREINKDQLESPQYAGYMRGDMVGQFGIESRWEQFLRGERGVLTVIVNASGIKIGDKAFKPEIIGHNLMLTIDREMQQKAEEMLREKRGAVVAMDVNSGEILTLVSSPGFDPNVFTGEVSVDLWRDLVTGKDKKMNNRALQGTYAPGSVFKIIMAVAALSEGVMGVNERVFCPGFYSFGGRQFKCHKHQGHGSVGIMEAMSQSCDVYFYIAGQRLGIDRISEYAAKFGLGEFSGLDLQDEGRGIVPSTSWKRDYFKKAEDKKWYPGETLSVAIGQGALTVTPIQIVRALAALVNGGKLMKPHIIRQIKANRGEFQDNNFLPEATKELELDAGVVKLVRNSLVAVVNDAKGTGGKAKLDKEYDIVVAGKTGTAQVASLHLNDRSEEFEDHAWFTGYAPADNPEIAVVALVENGGHGRAAAAPIVKEVMQQYFLKKQKAEGN